MTERISEIIDKLSAQDQHCPPFCGRTQVNVPGMGFEQALARAEIVGSIDSGVLDYFPRNSKSLSVDMTSTASAVARVVNRGRDRSYTGKVVSLSKDWGGNSCFFTT